MGAAIAIIVRKQHETVEVFQGARALSPETARVPSDLGIDHGMVFHGLVDRAILRPAGDGRYYLDEPTWIAHNTMRRKRVIIVLLMLVAFAAALGLGIVRLH